ncbi:LysM peptidoglycan-binding and 3D domain-containing protein [Rummeliibacillus suwonensis]|jgi:3D (Asp-Asp-Asp) domain-containing protein|uniref:LysM peptidoglycan-binding and 3D domain-containing protein n=1 Tax=Rummeliibacillus suwonensis TaxID=1306154 RepID=UPI0011B569B3|nr:3D domain-containing protein [Rummeliibacillus suwonensis]MBO2536697.1 LysM peptidoglycan-binding domain-containing protein [Rummeliibacillus suwonensis]
MKKYLIALAGVFALGTAALSTQASAASYKVEKGDTLWGISQDEKVSVEDLKEMNNLSSNVIVPSQQLETSPKAKTYKIKKGDTLFKIANETGVSVGDLKSFNNLSGDLIYAGENLALTGDSNSHNLASVSTKQTQTPANTQLANKQATNKQATYTKPSTSQSAPQSSGKTLTVTATAYTPNCAGCSGITATGINVKANPNMKVIAVDPSIIPLGSKVWVEGYGTAIAGDTGGAIKGHKIDLLMPSNGQANSWGVRTVTIKILN